MVAKQGIDSQRNAFLERGYMNICTTTTTAKLHMSPVSARKRPEVPAVDAGVFGVPVPEAWGPVLAVGTAPASAPSGAELGTSVLLVLSTGAVCFSPQAPVTAVKSWMLLSAAGVEPQLAAWVIQIESVSRSKTAETGWVSTRR